MTYARARVDEARVTPGTPVQKDDYVQLRGMERVTRD